MLFREATVLAGALESMVLNGIYNGYTCDGSARVVSVKGREALFNVVEEVEAIETNDREEALMGIPRSGMTRSRRAC